ncbi:unnamed protein product [Arctogadus glacialis]
MTEGLSDVWGTRSDWPTDPSLSDKLNISQQFDAGNEADRTDGQCISRAPLAKSMGAVNGRTQCERCVRLSWLLTRRCSS